MRHTRNFIAILHTHDLIRKPTYWREQIEVLRPPAAHEARVRCCDAGLAHGYFCISVCEWAVKPLTIDDPNGLCTFDEVSRRVPFGTSPPSSSSSFSSSS